MSYGLQIFDNQGRAIINTAGRFTRFHGNYTVSWTAGNQTVLVPVSGMVANDDTFALFAEFLAFYDFSFVSGGVNMTNLSSNANNGTFTLYRF